MTMPALADLRAQAGATLRDNTTGAVRPSHVRGLLQGLIDAVLSLAIDDVQGLRGALFSGRYADLIGRPDPFSGAYGDLTGKPTIPAVAGDIGAQPYDADLAAIALLSTSAFGRGFLTLADGGAARLKIGAVSQAELSSAIQAVVGMSPADLDTLQEIAARIVGGEGTVAALASTVAGKLAKDQNLADLADRAAARQNLGLLIGTDVQAYDADLAAIALLTTTSFGRGLLTLADGAAGRTAFGALAKAGDQMSGALDWAAPVALASAASVDIGAAASNVVDITGTTAITAFAARPAGATRWVRFAAGLTLTHNAASLILPTGASLATAAGDTALFLSLGSGNWRCLAYQRASGASLVSAASGPFPNGERAITATGTITAADLGKVLVISATAGTAITLTLDTAANLGTGFYCGVRRADGVFAPVSIAAASGQTADGRASIAVYQEDFTLRYAAATALRTQGRQRGWVSIGSVALTGQSLSALTVTSGFADPELSEIEFRFANLTFNGAGYPSVALAKGGTPITTGTHFYNTIAASPDAGGAPFYNLGESYARIPFSGSTSSPGPFHGVLTFRDINNTTGSANTFEYRVSNKPATSSSNMLVLGFGSETTNGQLTGFDFRDGSGSRTITAINYALKGFRA